MIWSWGLRGRHNSGCRTPRRGRLSLCSLAMMERKQPPPPAASPHLHPLLPCSPASSRPPRWALGLALLLLTSLTHPGSLPPRTRRPPPHFSAQACSLHRSPGVPCSPALLVPHPPASLHPVPLASLSAPHSSFACSLPSGPSLASSPPGRRLTCLYSPPGLLRSAISPGAWRLCLWGPGQCVKEPGR